MDLATNNLQRLICHKTQTTKTKEWLPLWYTFFLVFFKLDKVNPMHTGKILSVKKFSINFGSLPFCLRSYRSFIIPNFYAVSWAFSKPKMTVMCSFFFFIKLSFI